MKIIYKEWATGIKDTSNYEYKAVPSPLEFDDVQKIIRKQNTLEVLNGETWHIIQNIQAEVKNIEMSNEEREKVEDYSIT